MIRTWETTSYNTASAFTTARSYSHTVGGGSNRAIFQGISNEDFSTGGGAQTPSSVVYGGNGLTLDNSVTDASIQFVALYSGQDSVCGTAGAHNMVITYAGEVNATVNFTASCDNVKQQVKEATGSTANGSGSSKATSVTTLTAKSLIITVTGNDVGTGNTASFSVEDAELGDVANAGVMGAMSRYEKPTAGAQSITATYSGSATRTGIVSAAYETINDTPPVVTNIINQNGSFRLTKSVPCTLTKGSSDIARCDVSTDGITLISLIASGAAVITGNGSSALYVTGTNADVIATLGNGIQLFFDNWVDPGVAPILAETETITVLATDTLSATGSDTFDIIWGLDTGNGTLSFILDNATIAGINGEIATCYYSPTALFVGITYLYVLVTDGNGNTDEVIIPIVVSNPPTSNPPAAGAIGGASIRRGRRTGNPYAQT